MGDTSHDLQKKKKKICNKTRESCTFSRNEKRGVCIFALTVPHYILSLVPWGHPFLLKCPLFLGGPPQNLGHTPAIVPRVYFFLLWESTEVFCSRMWGIFFHPIILASTSSPKDWTVLSLARRKEGKKRGWDGDALTTLPPL